MNEVYGIYFRYKHNKNLSIHSFFPVAKRLLKVAHEKTKLDQWNSPIQLFINPWRISDKYFCVGYSPTTGNFIVTKDFCDIVINSNGEVLLT